MHPVHDPFLMVAIAEGFGESPVPFLMQPDLDPGDLLATPPEPPTVPPRVAERLRRSDLAHAAARLRASAERHGLTLLTPDDARWPPRLQSAALRPLVLFVRGETAALARGPAVAVVGSRTPTPYGTAAAHQICSAIARAGCVQWSGLARGIDAIAHEACTDAGVPTVAVVAGGLDSIYPPEHASLADRIVTGGGCLVAELPPGLRARRGHFIRRNRLLAAGAGVVVVVEGSLTSGALHTARFGAECGADVFAVPGPWSSERSQGCHRLIAEGAAILESPEALLQSLGLAAASPAAAVAIARCADEQRVLDALTQGPRPTDLLARECGLERAPFLRTLLALESRGVLARLPGDLWRHA